MKKYVEVFWTPFSPKEPAMQNLYTAPKPLLGILNSQRKEPPYSKCPAFQEIVKNEFVVTAPFDLNIKIVKEERAVYTDRYGQGFYDACIVNRGIKQSLDNPYMVSLPPYYILYSKDDVSIETKDVSLLTSGSTANIKVIPGGFNISKWVRPLEFAVEVTDASKPIEMRLGDPLFSIRFITPNNVPVKLTRVEYTKELEDMVYSCVRVKKFVKHLKLDKVYELAASYLSVFLKK